MTLSPTNSVDADAVVRVITNHIPTCDCDDCKGIPLWVPTNSVNIDVLLQKGLKRLYDRKIAAGSNDAAFVKYNQEQLFEAVKSGWQGKIPKLKYGSAQHELLLNLRHNTQVFSIFKVHKMTDEVHNELFTSGGNLRPFKDFAKAVNPILKDYNQNWLQAEYQTAKASARSAQKWRSFDQYAGDVMLTYVTVGDGQVRPEHVLLEGTTKPKTDPFWDTYYPPNGYRCRCYVRATPGALAKEPGGLPVMPDLFKVNVGKLAVALPPDHPYYQVDKKNAGKILKSFDVLNTSLDKKSIARNFKLFENYSSNPEIAITSNKETGGFVAIHKKADPTDLSANKKMANFLADKRGDALLINEHSQEKKVLNPEYTWNGQKSDLKTPKGTARGIVNSFDQARKQELTHVVIDASNLPDIETLNTGLKKAFRFSPHIDEAVVKYGENAMLVTRQMAKDGKIGEYIKKIALNQ